MIGDPVPGGLRNSIASSFAALDWKVETLDWGPWRPARLASAAFRAPWLAAGFRRRLRRQVDVLADAGSADLVVVVKGPLIDSRTVDHLRARLSAPVVCWNPDSPFDGAVSNRGAGIPDAVGAYDTYITWADDVAERLRRSNPYVVIIPFAWDPLVHRPTAGRGAADGRIVFVGTGTTDRVAVLSRIAHLRPLVFGERWPPVRGVEIHPPVFGDEMSAVIGEARWNLNILRPQNARSHNMRSFEVPGAGGNQVATRTADHERFLGRDSRTQLFSSHGELEAVLRMDPDELGLRAIDLLDGHTYVDRVRTLLVALGPIRASYQSKTGTRRPKSGLD
jgi:hypothetical protein